MTDVLGELDRRTLREQCLTMLRAAITDGRLRAGTRLVETELSAAFGVSRGTLREALRELQHQGLVVKGNRGLSVREFTPQEIDEIFAVRASLEGLAVETLARREDRDEVADQLEAAIARLAAAEGKLGEQAEADLDFHLLMCTLTGNTTLVRTWDYLSGHVRLTIMAAGPQRALHNMGADRHRPFIQSIRDGDADGGRRFVTEHMEQAAARIIQALASHESDLAES